MPSFEVHLLREWEIILRIPYHNQALSKGEMKLFCRTWKGLLPMNMSPHSRVTASSPFHEDTLCKSYSRFNFLVKSNLHIARVAHKYFQYSLFGVSWAEFNTCHFRTRLKMSLLLVIRVRDDKVLWLPQR